MSIYLILTLAVVCIVALLRKKIPIGPAILASGLLIWILHSRDINVLWIAFFQMLRMPRTYDLVFALYFVVCLEIELRKSGCLKGMVSYLSHLIPSNKVTLAIMPAFLGLLPSIGGARFSAPIVDSLAQNEPIDNNQKAAINFWFRHIFEFSSPIVPGMILACAITNIAIGDLIIHMSWLTVCAFAVGWLVLMVPIRSAGPRPQPADIDVARCRSDFLLSLLPIVTVAVLMMLCSLSASVAMGAVAVAMLFVLMATNRSVPVKDVFIGALEMRLFRDVGCILFFIQLLDVTGVLAAIVHSFDSATLPIPVIIATISFIIGVLTGLSQGHVAMVMPIVAAIAPHGSVDLVGVALVFGVGGQMITPTHVCLTVTLDYFKADFFKTLWPCCIAQALLLLVFTGVTWLTWPV